MEQECKFKKDPRKWTVLKWSDHFGLAKIFGADRLMEKRAEVFQKETEMLLTWKKRQ